MPFLMLRIDIPILKFLEEHGFFMSEHKLWENLAIISQIVKQSLECLAISVKEYFTFVCNLKSVKFVEKLGKERAWD